MDKIDNIQAVDSGITVAGIVSIQPIHHVSQADLVSILFGIKGTTFIGFSAVTVPSMNKTNNRFYGKVEKVSPKVNAVIGYQYARMVDNAQKRELGSTIRASLIENGVLESVISAFDKDLDGIVDASHQKFQSAGLKWGQYMTNPTDNVKSRILIDHTPKSGVYTVYAQMAILHSRKPIYRWNETTIELSDTEVSELKSFISVKKEGDRQDLVKPYIIRSYILGDIVSIVINNTQYVLK